MLDETEYEDTAELDMEEATASYLPDWENIPSIADLEKDKTSAQSDHSHQVSKINHWLDNLHVRGKAKLKKKANRSSVQPKLIRKQAEWRYAALSEPFLSTENIFTVRPVTHADKLAARQNGLMLNHQFNTLIDKVGFIDEYVRTAVDEGTIIVRIGWESEEEEYTENVPVYQYQPTQDPVVLRRLGKLQEMAQNDEYDFASLPEHTQQMLSLTMQTGVPHVAVKVAEEEVNQIKVTKNQPTLEICNYKNVIIDPSCEGKVADAKFVIYHFSSSIDDLNAAGIYFNVDKINPASGDSLADPDYEKIEETSFEFADKTRKEIVVTEYWGNWDIHGNGTTVPIVAAWVDKVLIRMEENPYPDKRHPFETVQYLPVRKAIHGEPDGVLLEDNQAISGALMRGMVDIMAKASNGQRGVRADALNLTNRRKFKDGEDFEYQGNVDPSQLFYTYKFPEIPNSAPLMLQLQNNEAESLTGVRAFSEGITGDGLGKVATGIRGALDAASKRELGILRRLAEGMKRIARRIIAMNGMYLSEEEHIRVTDEEFVAIKRDDLAGNLDLVVDISSAEVDNAKAQELAFMLQTMGNNMDPILAGKILSEIARLRRMPALAKEIEEFRPEPDPLAIKEAELRIAIMEADLERKRIEPFSEQAKAQLDAARTQTEASKMRKLDSEADRNSLDFVEQESGTKQMRDLEKQGAQARANMDLKVLEKQLDKNSEASQNT